MRLLNKTSLKFFGGFLAIVAGSIAIAYTAGFFSPRAQEERATAEYREYIEDLKEQYKHDTYGGETPEETLALFIEALENGDVELASKYFVVEIQEEMKEELKIGKGNDVLGLIVEDLKKEKRSFALSDIEHRFRTVDDNGVAEFSFDLILNTQTGKWKIDEL